MHPLTIQSHSLKPNFSILFACFQFSIFLTFLRLDSIANSIRIFCYAIRILLAQAQMLSFQGFSFNLCGLFYYLYTYVYCKIVFTIIIVFMSFFVFRHLNQYQIIINEKSLTICQIPYFLKIVSPYQVNNYNQPIIIHHLCLSFQHYDAMAQLQHLIFPSDHQSQILKSDLLNNYILLIIANNRILLLIYLTTLQKSLEYIFQIKEMENTNHQSEMLKYINLARQFPAYFISLIDKQLASFVNQREMPICEDVIYETNEGKSAWKQARKFLERQTTLLPFELHEGLNMSAKDHASDLAKHGIFGHTGSDKSTFSQRILKHCKKGQGAMAEIIGADFLIKKRNNAEMTILGLIIDDGVSDRGHRKTIFNPEYRYIGCKSQVQNDKLITVFNLTQNKLEIRGRPSTSVSYGNATAPFFKKDVAVQKEDKNAKTSSYLFNHPTQQDRTSKIQQQQRPVFQEISKNVSPLKGFAGQTTKHEGKSKKISQKKQNTKTWNQQGCRITQKITQILYSDGTTQENIQKHTVYC